MDQVPADGELVSRTLRGDRAAFDTLVARYQKLVYSIAYRVLGNHTDADDLVQVIFLRAYGGLKSFVQGTEFKSWLYAIAVNTSLNARKQSARQQGLVLKAAAGAKDADMPNPGARIMEEEARAGIEKAISMLPEDQRVVLHLRIREGLTHEEIARMLSCPTATVTSRIFLARKKLEGLLREFGT